MRAVAAPLIAWGLSNWLHEHASAVHGYNWYDALTRVRWDSAHYLTVAADGYQLDGQCVGQGCGNAGWFPAYPGAVWLVHTVGVLSWPGAAVAVSEAAFLTVLVLLWNLPAPAATGRRYAVLALATLWPGTIYMHAVFPTALTAACTGAGWLALTRRRWLLAGLAGAGAAAGYPVGALFAPAAFVYLYRTRPAGWVRQAVAVTALTAAGTVAALAVIGYQTRSPAAYFDVEAGFGVGISNPARSVWQILHGHGMFLAPGTGRYIWTHTQIITAVAVELAAAIALVVAAAGTVWYANRRGTATALDWSLLSYGALMLVVPLVIGAQVTQVRSHALMLPLALIFRHLRAAVTAVFAVAALGLAYAFGVLFVIAAIV